MKQLPIAITISWLAAACTMSGIYSSYSGWDLDADEALNRYEFINGYAHSGYFDKWSNGKTLITYKELYKGIFKTIDSDENNKVSMEEFEGRMDHYYFQIFNADFTKWDSNSNATLEWNEFYREVSKTNLGSQWDTSGDKRVSKSELADGMFYLSDANNNGKVDKLEFNIWTVNR